MKVLVAGSVAASSRACTTYKPASRQDSKSVSRQNGKLLNIMGLQGLSQIVKTVNVTFIILSF